MRFSKFITNSSLVWSHLLARSTAGIAELSGRYILLSKLYFHLLTASIVFSRVTSNTIKAPIASANWQKLTLAAVFLLFCFKVLLKKSVIFS